MFPSNEILVGFGDCSGVSRTLVRPDISSNRQKVELMSGRTQVLQLFWQFLKALMETVDPLSDRILIGKNYHKSISKTFCTILKTWPLLEFFYHLN